MPYTFLSGLVSAILFLGAFAAQPASAQGFVLQCRAEERISRIVVRTGLDDQFQFLGIECRSANGNRRILKSGIETGTRHEILTPQEIHRLRIAKGTCSGNGVTRFDRICSVSFGFADESSTAEFGAPLLTGSRSTLDGNGEIYGIAGVFRRGASDTASGYSDLRIVTRKLQAQDDPDFDIKGVLQSIRAAMGDSMGYVAVLRNPQGQRVGFVRAGWAIHPLDTSLSRHAGQFDVHTMAAVGSTTKAWASAVAALRVDEFTEADTLNTPFRQYLPRRWRDELHPRFDGVTVLDVIKHRAGFLRSGPNTIETSGELPARFRLRNGEIRPGVTAADLPAAASASPGCNAGASPYCRSYSNTAGGLFHFILPHMMLASVSGAPGVEDSLANLSDRDYDRRIAEFTGAFYEDFVQTHILDPVGARAGCDTRAFLGSRPVAAAYGGGQTDRTGTLPDDATGHCASGGWVMSANDLSKVLSGLRRDGILEPLSRARLLNLGPRRVWDVTTRGDTRRHHTHDGNHGGMRAAVVIRGEGHTAALIYNTGLGSGFSDQRMLVDAFDNNRR